MRSPIKSAQVICRFESGRFSSTSSTQARITADLLICRRLASDSTRTSKWGGNLSDMECMAVRYYILAKSAIPIGIAECKVACWVTLWSASSVCHAHEEEPAALQTCAQRTLLARLLQICA